MKIIISTIKRKKDFISQTIKSIQAETKDPIYLLVGGTETSYLKKYKNKKNIFLIDDLYQEEAKLHDIQKAAYGYYRALTLDRNSDVLIVEDDVVLNKGWYKTLTQFIEDIPISKYIISLINGLPEQISDPRIDIQSLQRFLYTAHVIVESPGAEPRAATTTWMNTSATYYPADVLKTKLADFVSRYAVHGKAVYDLAVGYFLFRMAIPVWITVPSLVQNLGLPEYSAMGHPEKRSNDDYSQWRWTA